MGDPRIHKSWLKLLRKEFDADYMAELRRFLVTEKAAGKTIYPHSSQWFHALDMSLPEDTRVVILGQDPYHGPGQAHGLCFSVPHGVPPPRSLGNIYSELASDLDIQVAAHGNLEHWARQGVLLLNSVLTVEAHQPASHKGKGWERFTDAIIARIAERKEPVIFMLWGAYAQKKAAFIRSVEDGGRHLVLRAAHPSPLAAHKGFFGCRHFSRCNDFLARHGQPSVDWALPPTQS